MNPVIIDVREPSEFNDSHVDGAINIPLGTILSSGDALLSLPKNGHYVVYCRSGGRAEQAKIALKQHGYSHVENGINQEHVETNYIY